MSAGKQECVTITDCGQTHHVEALVTLDGRTVQRPHALVDKEVVLRVDERGRAHAPERHRDAELPRQLVGWEGGILRPPSRPVDREEEEVDARRAGHPLPAPVDVDAAGSAPRI